MQIRRELELRQAERCLRKHSQVKDKEIFKTRISSLIPEGQKNFASAIDEPLRITTNSRDTEITEPCKLNTVVTTRYEIPKKTIPFAWGENIVLLGIFDGKKENWLHFIQTFKAVVDKQPYETVLELAILEQHLTGPARDCFRVFPFTENSYSLVLKSYKIDLAVKTIRQVSTLEL